MRYLSIVRPLVASAALLGLQAATADARGAKDALPDFDIKSSCRDAKALGASSERTDEYRSCLRDETKAREVIAHNWATYAAGAKRECGPDGPDPSYVEMLTCLQLDKKNDLNGSSDIGGPIAPGVQFK